VCPSGSLACQLKHARPKGSKHPAVFGHHASSHVKGIEVADHVAIGAGVVLDQRRVAHSEAQEEAFGVAVVEVGHGL
jgi:hypothetical protein